MKWLYDACGEYCDYRGYVIIKQIHPTLMKYAIYREIENEELDFVDVSSTIKGAKEIINEITSKMYA